ncbi:RDD family protein [Nocardioides sp.]|uniref:RDD family protein n=1 Tax=Nocardioides sp. TaxID=35761 RepID=UPI002D80E077|nr:RDD family protein [Nocardioides sp.]HET8961832.1 RDD family protein [Nocardioides sp.]
MTSAEGIPSAVPREARPYQGRRAGMVTRGVAGVVDAAVVLTAVMVGLLGVNALSFALDPRNFRVLGASQQVLIQVGLATAIVYLAGSWAVMGRTYGSRLMGLRIVDRQGRAPRLMRSLLRATLCVLFPLGLLWCGVVRSRKSLQDLVLGTSVVYDWMPEHHPRRVS